MCKTFNMKKLFGIVAVLIVTMTLSCKKKTGEGENCWDCEVQRRDGTTYKTVACRDDHFIPQFQDNLGNDLNSFCTRR